MLADKCAPPFCKFSFWFGSNPKNMFITLWSSHFFPHLGTHPSKMGEELLYDHLYHEEALFYLDVRPQLFIRPFIILGGISSP